MNSSAPTNSRRFERACEWFMELREHPESQDVIARWLEWCRADPLNRAAFERARQIWQATGGAGENLPTPLQRSGERARIKWKRAAWGGAIAASLVATLWVAFTATRGDNTAFATRAGENRSERLADGSTIVLGGDSRLLARFDDHSRHLTLERGEVYFKVAREAARPFVVDAGALRLTAIGTAFNVRTAPDRVVVDVAEGVVALERPDFPPAKASTRVVAGQQAAVDIDRKDLQVMRVESTAVASWQVGRLQFAREPLSAVIASVNRYSQRHVVLGDEVLGELRFTGTVFSDRVDDWLRGLPTIFPVTVREEGVTVIVTARH